MAAPAAPAVAAAPAATAGSQPDNRFASLYVGDLSPDVTEANLFQVFNAVGEVASIRVCRDSVSKRSLGYAYVNFQKLTDAERALDTLNYTNIKGRSCRIMWSHRDPAARKAGIANIFVKNLDPTIDNKALYDTFSLFGNILSCKVATDEKGTSKGYGFVHFETEESATQAIERTNGMKIGENLVVVTQYTKSSAADSAGKFTNLYVKSFPMDWDEEKLLDLFKPIGIITSSVLMRDKQGRPFAFVNYADAEDAQTAIDTLNNKDFGVQPREEKEGDAPKTEEEKQEEDEPLVMYVGRAQSKAERANEMRAKDGRPEGVTLYVKNLEEDMSEEKLKELFVPFGSVSSARIPREDSGKHKGFGFVSFDTAEEATKAVGEMHLKMVGEKPLYVGLAERRAQRQERLEQRYRGPGFGGGGKPGEQSFNMGPPMYGPGKGGKKGKGGGMGMMPGGMPGMGPRMQPMRPMMTPQQMQMMQMQQMQMMQMQQKGMMAGKGMPMMGKGMPPPQQQPQQKGFGPRPGPAASNPTGISPSALANAPPAMQKQMLGEKLYAAINKMAPELAGKITGMMLEMDNAELLVLLDSPEQLTQKVMEARNVLTKAGVRN